MTTEQILASNLNKTQKGKKLFELGLTRQEVAQLLNIGYGFAQNIYKQTFPDRIRSRQRLLQTMAERFKLEGFEFNNRFGIEIEAYNCEARALANALNGAGLPCQTESYNHSTRSHWKLTSDSSLSGFNTFELVSPILEGNDGLNQIKLATYVLKDREAKVNMSCGVHIHFDAEGFDLATWKRLYINYAKIEKIIDSFMPASRRANANTYCKSIAVNNYERLVNNASSLQEIERSITNRNRYYKLNTQSYWRQKSVEFRQQSGTIDYAKIENWILFLARLVEYSKHAIIPGSTWEDCKDFLPSDILYFLKSRADKLR